MKAIKQFANKIPGVPQLYNSLHRLFLNHKLKKTCTEDIEDIFTYFFFRDIKFRGNSGPGSDLYQTRVIIKELPILFQDLNISSILDIPCGDFHWMNSVDLSSVDYIGADIVKELVQKNRKKYERENLRFKHLNLISDKLPKVDIILCRDCLVHLCLKDIFQVLRNISNSAATYLLTTTFTSRRNNSDILTGQWRPLNLEISPFYFPKSLRIINEGCTEGDGSDKSLGLWRIEEIKRSQ